MRAGAGCRIAGAALALIVACGSPLERSPDGPRLAPMPDGSRRECRRIELLGDLCGISVPRMDGPPVDTVALPPRRGWRRAAFTVTWGAPVEGRPTESGPPRYLDVTLEAGEIGELVPGLRTAAGSIGEDPPGGSRRRATVERGVRWAGKRGSLVMMPGHPWGGVHAGHLAFVWNDGETDRVVSINAWAPVGEARAALRTMVASLPD